MLRRNLNPCSWDSTRISHSCLRGSEWSPTGHVSRARCLRGVTLTGAHSSVSSSKISSRRGSPRAVRPYSRASSSIRCSISSFVSGIQIGLILFSQSTPSLLHPRRQRASEKFLYLNRSYRLLVSGARNVPKVRSTWFFAGKTARRLTVQALAAKYWRRR